MEGCTVDCTDAVALQAKIDRMTQHRTKLAMRTARVRRQAVVRRQQTVLFAGMDRHKRQGCSSVGWWYMLVPADCTLAGYTAVLAAHTAEGCMLVTACHLDARTSARHIRKRDKREH